MTPLSFFVPGQPKPGGSKRAFLHPTTKRIIVKDDANNREWRQNVAFFARAAYEGEPLRQPLEVSMTFIMPRPKSHYGKRGLKTSAPMYPTCRPDVLKLSRSTEDACTGILWVDDACTAKLLAEKQYGEKPGVYIVVRTLEDSMRGRNGISWMDGKEEMQRCGLFARG